ncbi:hypothetical protein JCM11251_000660 [Rhodosporidiobolus azoricus]
MPPSSSSPTTPSTSLRPSSRSPRPSVRIGRQAEVAATSSTHSLFAPSAPAPAKPGSTSSPSPPSLARTSPLVGGSLARRKDSVSKPQRRPPKAQSLFQQVDKSRGGAAPHDDDDTRASPSTATAEGTATMARSVNGDDGDEDHSPPASPDLSSTPPAPGPPISPSLLTTLTPTELSLAPPAVLIALVERQQAELVAAQEKLGELEEVKREVREKEKEREGWKGRWEEMVGEQGRMEEELAGRVEVLDKLRGTVRDLERDKREATKRYREQIDTFESERQSWYDQEQHYKLRISNLSSAASAARRKSRGSGSGVDRRKSAPLPSYDGGDSADEEDFASGRREGSIAEGAEDEPPTPRGVDASASRGSSSPTPSTASSFAAPSSTAATSEAGGFSTPNPSATEVALRAQLDSLTTAHSSLTTTLRTLQTEMADLKRVYQDLQEENESYEILLGEKTLSGEVTGTDFFRKSFQWGEAGGQGGGPGWSEAFGFAGDLEAVGEEGEDGLGQSLAGDAGELEDSDSDEDSDDSDDDSEEEEKGMSRRNRKIAFTSDGDAGQTSEEIDRILLESHGTGTVDSGAIGSASPGGRRRSRRTDPLAIANGARTAAKKRPSLGAGGAVGAVGGGLDLGAELDLAREAEQLSEEEERRVKEREERKKRKKEEKERKREEKRRMKVAQQQGRRESSFVGGSEADLHAEIRQLREANKALTLYVSKIVDRVCSQEGFEKVLAVDYREKTPKTGGVSPPMTRSGSAEPTPPSKGGEGGGGGAKERKPRPASVGIFRTAASTAAAALPFTPTSSASSASPANLSASTSSQPLTPSISSAPAPSSAGASGPRKSGGLTWDSVSSVFGFGSSSATSTPPSNSMKPLILSSDSARKLDPAEEDEDEDDRRERERIRAEMLQLGFDPPPSRLSAGRPSLSRSSSLAAVPRTPEEERQTTLEQLERQEQEAKAELQQGRSSGFTDPPQRSLSMRMERRHSRTGGSISYRHSTSPSLGGARNGDVSPVSGNGEPPALGLGIKEEEGEGKEVGGDGGEGEQKTGIGKALRRLSNAWGSPTLG